MAAQAGSSVPAATTWSALPAFDPGDPRLVESPEAIYSRLRAEAPLSRVAVGGIDALVVSRYGDVARVLNDPAARMRPAGSAAPAPFAGGPAETLWRNAVSMMDPPEHTRVRKCLARAFTRQRIAGLAGGVETTVKEVLDQVDCQGEVNIARALSKIPMGVIGRLLGLPDSDWPSLEAWTNDVLYLFLPAVADAAAIERVQRASAHFVDYFGSAIDNRLSNPRDDLITELARQQARDGELTRGELIGALRGLLTAGIETTAATLSAAVLAMSECPEQFDLIRDGRATVHEAAEELLRWETPVQLAVRYLGCEVTLYGHAIPAGTMVWCLLGSANHDERHYRDPGRVNFLREPVAHHAFGGGRHFCLGAMLARLEIQEFLRQSVRRWRQVEIRRGEISRRAQFQFRSIQRLPAHFSPPPNAAGAKPTQR